MTRKSKRIMKRILAVVMAVALVPSNAWGTTGVVMAEETSEVFVDEETDVTAEDVSMENVQDMQEEVDGKEILEDSVVADDGMDADSAVVDVEETVEDDRTPEETEEKKETEKDSAETDNKAVKGFVHNFTTDGFENDDFFSISGNKQSKPTSFKYTDKSETELTLSAALKMEGSTAISFDAKQAGTLILVHPTDFTKSTKIDNVKKTAVGGIIEVALETGPHTVTKGDTTDLYYIAFIPEGAAQSPTEKPTATPTTDEGAVRIGATITLSCATAGAKIYYTTDGSTPDATKTEQLYSNEITLTNGMVSDEKDEITIKAYAVADGYSDSEVAVFTYTVSADSIKRPKPPVIDEASTSIISSVKLSGETSFVNQNGEEISNVILKAEKKASPSDNAIKIKAESLKKEGGEILYYDFTLTNADAPNDTVTIATGKLNIKMLYSIASASDVGKRNEIFVLHNANEVVVTNEDDGFSFLADSFSPYTVVINPAGEVDDIAITESGGYEEGAYAEWEAVKGADGYMAYVAPAGGDWKRIDDALIREYEDYWRVDTVGLAKGTYYIKINAVILGTENGEETATVVSSKTTKALKVTNYDRSGFAFSPNSTYKTASGAYNEDGTLKEGAQVIYVTAATAKTCKANVGGAEVTGFQGILDAKQKKDTSGDIIDIRIIGCVTKDDLDGISSSAEGIQIKGNKEYTNMNITVEGIGEDATVKDFGFLLRNCANVEFRNFGILNCMDDGVSIDTDNCNLWMHDLDIFYGKGGSGDKAKGDGALDIKKSQYCTVSYVHFWDTGKSCLLDASAASSGGSDYITYHHNWFDHSDSRHPRVRNAKNVHVYNNYYDGNAKYGVGSTTGSSTFVEANYFRNCKNPMMIADQGTDAKGDGTFSSEPGGMIKAYGNYIEGASSYLPYSSSNTIEFDAYEVTNSSEQVPESVKTKGGSSYNNFDTASTMYTYTADMPDEARDKVVDHAGRLNQGDLQWTFDNATEDANYAIITELKTAVTNYKTSVKTISGGVTGNPVVKGDNNSPAGSGDDSIDVQKPKASVASGEVEVGTKVELSCDTEGAEIYYTTNGSTPKLTSDKYTSAIEISANTTIKAIAFVGDSESEVSTFRYTIPGSSSGGNNPVNPPSGDDQNTTIVTYEFNPEKENLTVGTMPTADKKYGTEGYFTIGNTDEKGLIKELSTNGKKTTLTGSFKSDQKEYSIRYQFGGTAAKDDSKAIRFHSNNKAKVYVAAYRTGDTTYNLYLDTDDNVKELSRTITEYTFDDVEAGDHSIYAKDGNIAILYVIVEEFVPNGGSGDDGSVIDPPTAAPVSENIKKGASIQLSAAGDIYYTMTTDGSTPVEPTTSSDKYENPIMITTEAGATVKIKAIAVVDGKSSTLALFEYKVIADDPEVKDPLSKPEPSPVPDADKTYPVGLQITLTSKENGTIYYTLDGSDPKKADGQPSETSKPLAENESITLSTVGTHTIKAFAVKEGYPSSDTAVFTYTIAENATLVQLKKPTIDPESKDVEKGEQIIVTIKKAADDPADAEIYYTTDGTVPSKTSGQLYKEPFTLTVNSTMTITAIVVKDGTISSPTDSVAYTVKEDNAPDTHKEGLWVELKDKGAYTYTGSAIKPDIVVGNYDDELVEGVDYTVAYKNNINAAEKDSKKAPQIIVTGKGNLTGKAIETFTIKQRPLSDVVVAEAVKDGADSQLLVVENTKPAPTLYYGGAKLGKKDYTVSVTDKCTTSDAGRDIKITGSGNYTGELSYKLKVIAKDDFKKFTVAFTDSGYTYDGTSKTLLSTDVVVTDSSKTDTDGNVLAVNDNYQIVYQNDTVNAGKVKFTVVGLGLYSGAVTKTYTIKPVAVSEGFNFTIENKPITTALSYPYNAAGVTIPNVGITYNGKILKQGKDYKLAYGNNKKVGTAAKISATFMGNYKGSKIEPMTFEITQVTEKELSNQTQGLKIAIADQVYKKPGVYKSVPYVSVNGVEIKSSEYIVKYYTSGTKETNGTITVDPDTEMGSKNKIELSETEPSKPVYVEITGKGKNYADTMKLTASYSVRRVSENAIDLSKAKLTVYKDWKVSDTTDKANKGNKMEYTGRSIEPGVMIELKDLDKTELSPVQVKELIDAKKITVQYTNNVEKGKATIVINGNGTDYVGGKIVTFSITTKSLQNEADLLTDLFKNINNIIKG